MINTRYINSCPSTAAGLGELVIGTLYCHVIIFELATKYVYDKGR